jgi:hypothetical protein
MPVFQAEGRPPFLPPPRRSLRRNLSSCVFKGLLKPGEYRVWRAGEPAANPGRCRT